MMTLKCIPQIGFTMSLAVAGLIFAGVVFAGGAAGTRMTGKVVEYEIAGYHLRVEFQAEDRLRWEYLSAPNDLTGKSAVETVDRRDIRPGVVLMAWTEADGSNVIDIFDLEKQVLHANFVTPDGERFFSIAELTVVK